MPKNLDFPDSLWSKRWVGEHGNGELYIHRDIEHGNGALYIHILIS